MANVESEELAFCLLNILDKCDQSINEATYAMAANVFNGVELALSVVLSMVEANNNERQPFFFELCEYFAFWRTSSMLVAATFRD